MQQHKITTNFKKIKKLLKIYQLMCNLMGIYDIIANVSFIDSYYWFYI